MKYLCATTLFLMLCGSSQAQPPAGVPQADGSMVYALDFGAIVTRKDGKLRMTVKGAKHWLLIDVKGFEIRDMKSMRSGIMFNTEVNAEGVIMSAYFESVGKVANSSDCRNFYFPRALSSPAKKENPRKKDDGARAIGAYVIVEKLGDVNFTQEHRNIYLYGSGHCADVHIAKANFEPEKDEAAMHRVTRSISLAPAAD